MKKFFKVFLLLLFIAFCYPSVAQLPQRHKIALFAPLYLDSAFDAGYNYRFNKSFPKFLNPGLEFYQGAQLALDSLDKAGAPLEVYVYDTRSRRSSLAQQLMAPELRNVEMIIAHANSAEVRVLAEAAKTRKVPFVSTTLPNDAGITNNPYYVILNSTLRTHCENIYKYLQQNHGSERIYILRKGGAQEDLIKGYFQEFLRNTASAPLKIQYKEVGNEVNLASVSSELDSTRRNVFIAGSLDEAFGNRVLEGLSGFSETYPITLIGMPTWDGLALSKPDYKAMEIIYSTPFYYGRWSALSSRITNDFVSRINGRPTDMYYRGYETMLRFALLLLDTKKDVASNLTRKGNYVFTQFDIQPVFLNKQNMTLDYFENKKLYIVRYVNGVKAVQ